MTPVTVADYRPASLSISIVIIIHRQRNRTLEDRCGQKYNSERQVFASQSGMVLSLGNLTKQMKADGTLHILDNYNAGLVTKVSEEIATKNAEN